MWPGGPAKPGTAQAVQASSGLARSTRPGVASRPANEAWCGPSMARRPGTTLRVLKNPNRSFYLLAAAAMVFPPAKPRRPLPMARHAARRGIRPWCGVGTATPAPAALRARGRGHGAARARERSGSAQPQPRRQGAATRSHAARRGRGSYAGSRPLGGLARTLLHDATTSCRGAGAQSPRARGGGRARPTGGVSARPSASTGSGAAASGADAPPARGQASRRGSARVAPGCYGGGRDPRRRRRARPPAWHGRGPRPGAQPRPR